MHLNALVDSVILQRADHFQTRAIAHMCKARIFMATKIPLKDASIVSPVE
jgi:hypothetical protein